MMVADLIGCTLLAISAAAFIFLAVLDFVESAMERRAQADKDSQATWQATTLRRISAALRDSAPREIERHGAIGEMASEIRARRNHAA
jgi:hypothetical protein